VYGRRRCALTRRGAIPEGSLRSHRTQVDALAATRHSHVTDAIPNIAPPLYGGTMLALMSSALPFGPVPHRSA